MNFPNFPIRPVLVVDDEPSALHSVKFTLGSAGINNTLLCRKAEDVMQILNEKEIELILLDLIMPGITGDKLLAEIYDEFPEIPVMVITGDTQVDMAVQCMKKGAFDYMVKPVEKNRLISSVRRAIEIRCLQAENGLLKNHILTGELSHPDIFSNMITRNRSMLGLFQYAESIARSSQPVLITGETGVGKELMARAIHKLSGRKGPLISINVAAVDDTTFSDTMFGHVSGAYTGADKNRKGMVENASGGTLFLDEIGDIRSESQIKLLRLLQEREYMPLGADLPRNSDVRIIVATNCDLKELQISGRFRKDLYFRLCSHHLDIPPLRKRLDDLPLLIPHFIRMAAHNIDKDIPAFPKELVLLLGNYSFPGNIRELKSMIFDVVASHTSGVISMKKFQDRIELGMTENKNENTFERLSRNDWFPEFDPIPTLEEVTHCLFLEAMNRSKNNQSLAAKFLGISRQRLGRHLKSYARDNSLPPEK